MKKIVIAFSDEHHKTISGFIQKQVAKSFQDAVTKSLEIWIEQIENKNIVKRHIKQREISDSYIRIQEPKSKNEITQNKNVKETFIEQEETTNSYIRTEEKPRSRRTYVEIEEEFTYKKFVTEIEEFIENNQFKEAEELEDKYPAFGKQFRNEKGW